MVAKRHYGLISKITPDNASSFISLGVLKDFTANTKFQFYCLYGTAGPRQNFANFSTCI